MLPCVSWIFDLGAQQGWSVVFAETVWVQGGARMIGTNYAEHRSCMRESPSYLNPMNNKKNDVINIVL